MRGAYTWSKTSGKEKGKGGHLSAGDRGGGLIGREIQSSPTSIHIIFKFSG